MALYKHMTHDDLISQVHLAASCLCISGDAMSSYQQKPDKITEEVDNLLDKAYRLVREATNIIEENHLTSNGTDDVPPEDLWDYCGYEPPVHMKDWLIND